jgi:hypothetical protein
MKLNACLEARSAWAMWREQKRSERTVERLEAYVRHWCQVYARSDAYTQGHWRKPGRWHSRSYGLASRNHRYSGQWQRAGRSPAPLLPSGFWRCRVRGSRVAGCCTAYRLALS